MNQSTVVPYVGGHFKISPPVLSEPVRLTIRPMGQPREYPRVAIPPQEASQVPYRLTDLVPEGARTG